MIAHLHFATVVDDDAVNDAATIAHADEYDPVANVDLAVTVTDNDTAGITLSALAAITEGSSGTYTIKLNAEPSSDVVISLTVSGSSEVTVADTDTVMTGVQNTLTFTSSNWSTAQTVTVNAGEDDDAVNDAATIAHAVVDASSADEYDPVANVDLAVTVTDNDTAGITLSALAAITEGSSGTYTIKLNAEPSSDVVISLTVSGSSEVTVADTDTVMTGVQNTLTFTSSDWSTAQTVTVEAAQDDDAVNDAATIAHAVVDASSADEYDPVANEDLAVAVTDDDTAGITLSALAAITEGESGTYTVKLNTQPSGDVVISLTASGSIEVTIADTDGEMAGVQNTLTFTSSNWSTPQTVTVNAGEDDDAVADAATITHAVVDTSSAAEYDPVANADLAVTVTDDDTAGITLSALAAITEGESGTYTVKLNTQPSGDVVISLTASGSIEVTIADTDGEMAGVQNTLTFTSSDWSTAQTVTVNAGEDDDAVNDAATIAHAVVDASSAAEYDPVANVDLVVSVTDDDTAGITVTATDPFTVAEGASATYTVKLNTQPSSDVVLALTSNNAEVTIADTDGEMTGVQNTLTFTSSDWNTAQTVTVNAADDDDAVADSATIAHAVVDDESADEYDPVANVDLAVSVTDDDTAGITVTATDPFTVGEGGSATYTVELDTEPSSDVVISLTVSGSSDVTVADTNTVMMGVQNTLTFTSSNWSTAQTATVNAGEDDDAVADSATIAHAVVDDESADEYDPVANVDLAVTVTDDDTAGITVSVTQLTVTEAAGTGRTATYTVKLNTQPTGDVTITPSSSAESAATVSGALTFTSSNWSTAQTVTVTGVDDAVDQGDTDRTATISHTVSGGDYGEVSAGSVSVSVTDDDTAGITVSVTQLTVTETAGAGRTATYTVKLNTQPTGNVTITASSSDDSAATVSGALTFTSTNWSTVQTVTVTGVDDAVDQGGTDRTATISHKVSGGDYGDVSAASVSVTVTDDDTAGVTVTADSPFTVLEGGSDIYTLKLNSEPTSDVVISLSSNNVEVTIADTDGETDGVQNTLTFTSSNWSMAQTVTVNAAQDDDTDEDSATITHASASSDTGYDGIEIPAVQVTVLEPSSAAVVPAMSISAVASPITEGQSAKFTITAHRASSEDKSVSVAVSLTPISVGASTVQTVTVSAGAIRGTLTVTTSDNLVDEPNRTITATIQDGTGYVVGTANTASVIVNDDDSVPGAPTGIQVVPGDGRVVVSWAAPLNTGSQPISRYIVEYGESSDFTASTTANTPNGSTTEFTIARLTNGVEYHFRVLAVNRVGTSLWSDPATGTPVASDTGRPPPDPTPTPTPVPTPGSTPDPTPMPTAVPTPGSTPDPTLTPTSVPTPGSTPDSTLTPTPVPTPGSTPDSTLTPTAVSTPGSTPDSTPTPTAVSPPGSTPDSTLMPTAVSPPGSTPDSTPTRTAVSPPGSTPDPTPTPTVVSTLGSTPAPTPTPTAVSTPGSTADPTPTPVPADATEIPPEDRISLAPSCWLLLALILAVLAALPLSRLARRPLRRQVAGLMRNILKVLAAIQLAWPTGLALLSGSADGMTGWDLAALLATQAVGAAGLVILARMGQPLSRRTAARAMALLVIALVSDLLLAATNLLGVTGGHWCLPLTLGLIPVIGLAYAYWNLRRPPTATYSRPVMPRSTMHGGGHRLL